MRGVEDEGSARSTSKGLKTLCFTRCTEQVRGHYRAGVIQSRFRVEGIKMECSAIGVCKSGKESIPSDRVRGRREGEARQQYRLVGRRDDA
jgi:hypothetical protein